MDHINVFFKRLQSALEKNNLNGFTLRPKQVICLDYLYRGIDVVAVLPTGFGKSLIYQVLPFLMPLKEQNNIVIVVAPLNSIIEDQIGTLKDRGIKVDILHTESGISTQIEKLFDNSDEASCESDSLNKLQDIQKLKLSKDITEGKISFLLSHPESLLSKDGRNLLRSKVYQENVVAIVVDEAHCVEMW